MSTAKERPRVVLLAAMSIDGFIAPADKEALPSTTWTSKEDWRFFTKRSKELGTLIMGSATFETIRRPLAERQLVVLTSQPQRYASYSDSSLTFTDEAPAALLARLANQGIEQVALCGGAKVYGQFLQADLVDELQLTVEPYIFGRGIKLCDVSLEQQWRLVEQQPLNEQGTVAWRYEKS